MEISKLLWSPGDTSNSEYRASQARCADQCHPLAATGSTFLLALAIPPSTMKAPGRLTKKNRSTPSTTVVYTAVPDKERKRSYRLSATQKQTRRDKEAFDSRELNLTLDINQLRQEIQTLTNCRDLKVTRLLLDRQQVASEVLVVVDRLLFGARRDFHGASQPASMLRDTGCSFSGTLLGQSSFVPPMGVYEFTLQLDLPSLRRCCDVLATTQVLSFVEEDACSDTDEDAKLRRICGDPGGCVVEALGSLAGRFTREAIGSLFPHILGDEVLTARFVGLTITFPARLHLYFDARQQLVHQIAQTDVVDVLNAVQQVRPAEFAIIMNCALEAESDA